MLSHSRRFMHCNLHAVHADNANAGARGIPAELAEKTQKIFRIETYKP